MKKIFPILTLLFIFCYSCSDDSEPKPVITQFNGVWFSYDSTYKYNFYDDGWHERTPAWEEGQVKWRVEIAEIVNGQISMWLVFSDSNRNHIETYSPRFSNTGDSVRLSGLLGHSFHMHR